MRALVDAFNQDKALVGAFSMFVKTDGSFAALVRILTWLTAGPGCWALIIRHLSTGPARGTPGRPGWQSVGSCRVAPPNTQCKFFLILSFYFSWFYTVGEAVDVSHSTEDRCGDGNNIFKLNEFRITCTGGCIRINSADYNCEIESPESARRKQNPEQALFPAYVKNLCDGKETCLINNRYLTPDEKTECEIINLLNTDSSNVDAALSVNYRWCWVIRF